MTDLTTAADETADDTTIEAADAAAAHPDSAHPAADGSTDDTAVESTASVTTAPRPRRPAPLRGSIALTLHTNNATMLLLGRRASDDEPNIPGINQFDAVAHQIRAAAAEGDVYALVALLSIDERLLRAERLLAQELHTLEHKLSSSSRLSVEVSLSTQPVVHDLRLTTPYAHWAARLIASYDELVATALSARRAGFIADRELAAISSNPRKDIRRAFYAAYRFRFTGVTREDFDQGNARAKEAVEQFGDIPSDVLRGQHKPAYLY